jgi:large subunit ribosomal protein L3
MKGIIGRKIGMTQVFDENGMAVPVTVIEAGPCHVVQRKTQDKDGYEALQLGFQEIKSSKVNKPVGGHFGRHEVPSCRVLKEFRVEDATRFASGQTITVAAFEVGEKVKVTGKSKGRGFTGVVKRHGFHGASKTHGTHEYFRHGGAIGAAADPARVFKGKKMPGQYGSSTVTVGNITVFDVRPEANLILLKGAVPGPNRGVVILRAKGEFPIPAAEEEPVETEHQAEES